MTRSIVSLSLHKLILLPDDVEDVRLLLNNLPKYDAESTAFLRAE